MNERVAILLVQDDQADRDAVLDLIRQRALPWQPTCASTLAQARAHLSTAARFDLIIADYRLPDGLATTLFEPGLDLPVIVLTTTIEQQSELCALDRGADDSMSRALLLERPETLLMAVEKTLHRVHLCRREHRLQRDLSDSERRLNLALESGRAGMVQWDLHNNKAWWNAYSYLIHGYEPFSFEPTYAFWRSRIHPDDVGRVEADIALCLTQRKSDMVAEYRIIRPSGEVRWVQGIGRFLFDAEGFANSFTGIALDITDRKRMEDELAAVAQLPAENPAPILRLSRAGQLLYVNRAAELLLKATSGALKTLQAASATVLQSGQTHEFDLTCNDQRLFSFICVPVPARDYANCYGRDVTEIQRAKAAAEQANSAKDQFLAVLSHELRTPLTPVLSTATLMEADAKLPERYREDLAMIRRNAEMEARLIDDLLDVTRITRGKVDLHRQPVELSNIIRRAAEVCRPDIEARQLHFGIDVDDATHPVDADAARLQQVFWNLIKNAVKFTPHSGCVGVRCWRESGKAMVQVIDSGTGIEPEALGRIFDAFTQEAHAAGHQFGGLGLGLTISKALVEMHGGAIRADSAGTGKGATFTVELPLCQLPPSAPRPPQVPEQPERQAPDRKLRILLVEDHGDTARVIRRILTAGGHTVEHAGDLATALQLASHGSFDVLLSDLGLPDGSGHDLLRQLAAQGRSLPAIALSGYGMASDIQASRDAGFLEHVIKPVDMESLLLILNRVTAKPRTAP